MPRRRHAVHADLHPGNFLIRDGTQLIVFDAGSLKEVKRIPMKKPSGKYNVYNKITRSEGTSH